MKQTAVEWFYQRILAKDIKSVFEQALEMEKQQIEEAFQYKFFHPYVENEPEQYYNETYNKP